MVSIDDGLNDDQSVRVHKYGKALTLLLYRSDNLIRNAIDKLKVFIAL